MAQEQQGTRTLALEQNADFQRRSWALQHLGGAIMGLLILAALLGLLMVRLDPSLLAHVEHRASRATRTATRTNMLAKRHEKAVDFHPVLLRQHGFEGKHGAFRRSLRDISPPVGDTMDMDIDPNRRLMTRNA
jgi:hypothetical protein